MSAEGEKPKPTVCENFEPQAWRKTICKNCFQSPDKHVPGETAGAPGHAGKENKPPLVPEKPKPGIKMGADDKNVSQKSDKEKAGTSLAHSIKDKYEQLEKDKYGTKEPPKVAPKTANNTKANLSSITDKYEKLKDEPKPNDGTKTKSETKSNDNIPSSQQNKKDNPVALKLFGKKDETSELQKSLNKTKFGSVENVSKTDEKPKVDFRLASKSKFGSMENVSGTGADKTKEPIQIPIQRGKFGGSVETLSSEKHKVNSSNSDLAKRTLLNKLDDFSAELKAGATSKSGSTVIHKQSDGNIDVIPIPKKSNTPKQIDNEALQNEMNELKMARIGDKSGQIKPQTNILNKSDIKQKQNETDTKQQISIKHETSPTKSVSPERKPGFKLDLGKSDESGETKQLVRRNSGFKLEIGTPIESPEIKPGFKIDFRKSESPTKDPKRRNGGFKLEFDKSESPTKEPLRKSPEKKSGFKINFDKSESPTKEPQTGDRKSGFKLNLSPSPTKEIVSVDDKNKTDLRSSLKKSDNKPKENSIDTVKPEGKQKFELPLLKSAKDRKEETKSDIIGTKSKEPNKGTENESKEDKTPSFLKSSKFKTEDKNIKSPGKEEAKDIKKDTMKVSSDKGTEKESNEDKTPSFLKSSKFRIEDKNIKSPGTEDVKDIKKDTVNVSSDKGTEKELKDDKTSPFLKSSKPKIEDKNIKSPLAEDVQDITAVKVSSDKVIDTSKAQSHLPNSEIVTEIPKNSASDSQSAKDDKVTNKSKDSKDTHGTISLNNSNDSDIKSKEKTQNGASKQIPLVDTKAVIKDKEIEENELTIQLDNSQDLKTVKDATVLSPGSASHKKDIEATTPSKDQSIKDISNDTTIKIKTDSQVASDSKNMSDKNVPHSESDINKVKVEKDSTITSNEQSQSSKDELKDETPKSNNSVKFEFDEKKQKDKEEKKQETPKLKQESKSISEKGETSKTTESKEKTESKGKFDLPGLKSNKSDKDQPKHADLNKSQDSKSKRAEEVNDKTSINDSKGKFEPKKKVESPFLKSNKTTEDEKKKSLEDKKKTPDPKPSKSFEVPKLKSTKSDEKEKDSKFLKTENKLGKTDEPKRKFEVPSLKSNKEDKEKKEDKKFSPKQEEPKKKFELPNLRSKHDDKGKVSDKVDLKPDDKKKGFEVPKLKSSKPPETEKKEEKSSLLTKKDEPKKKFELPNLKSSKQDEKSKQFEKPGLKTKTEEPKNKVLDRLNLKSAKDDKSADSLKADKDQKKSKPLEIEKQSSNTFERPKLKSAKDQKVQDDKSKDDDKTKITEKNKITDKIKTEDKSKFELKSKSDDKAKTEDTRSKFQKDIKEPSKTDVQKDPKDSFPIKSKGEKERETSGSVPVEKSKPVDTSSPSTIGTENFDIISADNEAKSSDEDYACATDSASEDNYLHVDTQVFTSSRNKTAEVTGGEDSSGVNNFDFSIDTHVPKDNDSVSSSLIDNSIKEEEQLNKSKHATRSPSPVSVYISSDIENDSSVQNDIREADKHVVNNDDEISRLRQELLLMTERCSNLEKENTSLRDGLHRKDDDQVKLKQQKDEVDNVIKGLQGKIQSMEDACEQLEFDNKNLKNTLKAQIDQQEQNENNKNGNNLENDGVDENVSEMEEMIEENEQLKQEVAELKLEMDEMYDSFRDQEAEEFRELQKELEITAKNCRILQFKLRKLERHNDQVEHDRNEFENRLRRLQDQFQDRDAVSHIHSLEDELRMAKDVSVRLHDELDLLEEKRGKMEDENRHLTELLEQSDRKQFRLELEVDKLRDKVMQLRTELSAAKDPNSTEPRKASLEVIGRQSSQENEIQQLKRELYDCKEREMDLKDQLQNMEDNAKKSSRRVIDLEEENDNLSTQLKKLSIETAIYRDKPGSSKTKPETDVELKIQFEMADKELTCLRRKLADLDEENEMLHEEVFSMEMKLKEKDKQLLEIPEPTSPSVYYEDKIKEFEKEANEFRSILLNKDQEIESLYAQLQSTKVRSKRGIDLRKSKSLDYEIESGSEYGVMVDLKRQLELSQQECSELREKMCVITDENDGYKNKLESLTDEHKLCVNSPGLAGLAVAYVKTGEINEMRQELSETKQTLYEFRNNVTCLLEKYASIAKSRGINVKSVERVTDKWNKFNTKTDSNLLSDSPLPCIDTISNKETIYAKSNISDDIAVLDSTIQSANLSSLPQNTQFRTEEAECTPEGYVDFQNGCVNFSINLNDRQPSTAKREDLHSQEFHQSNTADSFRNTQLQMIGESSQQTNVCYEESKSGSRTGNSEQTYSESRDLLYLLSSLDDVCCKLVQTIEMESGDNENVVPQTSINILQSGDSPEMDYCENIPEVEDPSHLFSENGKMTELIVREENDNLSKIIGHSSISGTQEMHETMVTDIDDADDNFNGNIENDTNSSKIHTLDTEGNISLEFSNNFEESQVSKGDDHSSDNSSCDVTNDVTHVTTRKEVSVTQTLLDTIRDLEERIDDLRFIIKTKEEKNILLEEEIDELRDGVKKVQNELRRREMELLQEMDLIHGKNEILNNLLEIVKDRAETAEDELERIFTEINESRDSPVSSEKSIGGISEGSDDVFDVQTTERTHSVIVWEEQFKKRIRSLENLLAEERKKVTSLEKKLEISGSDVISSAMSDDAKLHMREKELLQSELKESQKHAIMANEQIRSLTDKLKKAETQRWGSPNNLRKHAQATSSNDESEDISMDTKTIRDQFCKTCSELQSVKDQLCDELIRFKEKAEELEGKVEEINDIWVSKSAVSEKEKQSLEQKLRQKLLDCKKLEELLNKQREEDRMKDIFLKERDNALKEKAAQITRKEELITEQEDIIRQREEDLQSLFDQISQREKSIKELTETITKREEQIKTKDDALKKLTVNIEEKTEELHYLEEEVQESTKKRKESETLIAEMKEKIEETLKGEKSEVETENERLQSDLESLMGNITDLHQDKLTLQTELDKAKQALSEAMLMWDRDRSTLSGELSKANEKLRMFVETSNKKESVALQTLRNEVHSIIDTKEKLAHELRLTKMDYDNQIRILKTEKFKLAEELTSKIRMLAHEMTNNDKMTDELNQLRGQDEINYQLHHHEKILRAEYLAMKVRYETQLDRLQKEHLQLLTVVERLQKEKNLDQEIIVGIQKGMANIKETYTHDLTRWKDERNVLESHISQIEEGKEIACNLRAQIDALKRQLVEQEMERSDLVNKMTTERRDWDMERVSLSSKINQLEEQLAVFVQVQSKNKDVQYRMEITWEKEREEQKRLLAEAHSLAVDLQEQLHKRDEEHARERSNLLEQLEKHRREFEGAKMSEQRMSLELNTGGTKVSRLEQQLEETRDRLKHESDAWMSEKAELLRRLAEIRKLHVRYVRRTEDVLTSLKRLRELAAIVSESDSSLPSNGHDDASASGAIPNSETDINNVKQNIDQVILKYVKESLKQLHFASEELARPPMEISRDEKQKIRRSLSSSEIELLKDELLLGPNQTYQTPEADKYDKDKTVLHRQITHDGENVRGDHLPADYIENILMEQSTFYNDGKYSNIEIRRIKTGKEVTRTETSVTSLPRPPPSFIIPRSRSKSPSPFREVGKQSSAKVLPIDTASYRLSAPPAGVTSRSSSADSSPSGNYPSSFIPSATQNGLLGAGTLQSGSLDRLSPSTARRRFFESQPTVPVTSNTWSNRGRYPYKENRNSKSLSNSTEFNNSLTGQGINVNGQFSGPLRSSVSMDDGSIIRQELELPSKSVSSDSRESVGHGSGKHSSSFKDMFNAMKRKLKPKIKRSQSARDQDMLRILEEKEKKREKKERKEMTENNQEQEQKDSVSHALNVTLSNSSLESKGESLHESTRSQNDVTTVQITESKDNVEEEDKHNVQDNMTPINIPEMTTSEDNDNHKKDQSRSRSPAKKESQEKDRTGKESTLQKIKKRFRSKSADRARDKPRDRHVTPILVGHSTTSSDKSDPSWQYSETCV